jgi:hypothetical protein
MIPIHILALAAPSEPGIITSVASVFTALILCVTALIGLLSVRRTNGKLDVIHTLVNSTLTAALESDLSATKQSLATMEQLTALRKADGEPISPETVAAMNDAQAKVDSLTQQMADRLVSAQHVLASAPRHNPKT